MFFGGLALQATDQTFSSREPLGRSFFAPQEYRDGKGQALLHHSVDAFDILLFGGRERVPAPNLSHCEFDEVGGAHLDNKRA